MRNIIVYIGVALIIFYIIMFPIMIFRMSKVRKKCKELASKVNLQRYLPPISIRRLEDIDKAHNKASKLIDRIYETGTSLTWKIWKPIDASFKDIEKEI